MTPKAAMMDEARGVTVRGRLGRRTDGRHRARDSTKDIFRCLRAFEKSGSSDLLTTTYPGLLKRQWNVLTGMWRPLDLQLPPFNFPKPLRLINEQTTHPTDYSQKSLGPWKIESLPV